MQKLKKPLVTLMIALLLGVGAFALQPNAIPQTVMPAIAPAAKEARSSMIIELPPLDVFVEAVFDECGGNRMSPAIRAVRKAQLLRIVEAHPRLFGMRKYDYIAVPCAETAMGSVKTQVSTAGALGFAQLMPATAKAEAKIMGIGELKDSDLQDNELNITISVNHYARLADEVGPECAAAAYNGGSAALSVKDCKSLRSMRNAETAGYVSVAYVIMRKHMKEVLKQAEPVKKSEPTKKEEKLVKKEAKPVKKEDEPVQTQETTESH